MRISARTDYALRAALELAAAGEGGLVKAEDIAHAHGIPLRFLLNILIDLRHAGIVSSQRGSVGGYRLARPPADVTLAEVVRAMAAPDGPAGLATAKRPPYLGAAAGLEELWTAAYSSMETLLETVALADVVRGGAIHEADSAILLKAPSSTAERRSIL
jgi:Rrf2 family protein